MKIAVMGANSSVGQNLLAHLSQHGDLQVVAAVRSERALADLPKADNIEAAQIDYSDSEGLVKVLEGADAVVHLAGILIESKHSNYATANVAATAAVSKAAEAAGVSHLIFISVIGASPDARNAYFRSKGTAEQLVTSAGLTGTVLRTPLLLGPNTAGANSLIQAAKREQTKVLGGGYYVMRPLDVDDLSQAIISLCRQPDLGGQTYELVGPEGMPYRELIARAAARLGREVEIKSVPVWLAKAGAAFSSLFSGGGITPTVIDVITSNERVTNNADQALGLSLTSLDQTLDKLLKS